MAIPAGTAQAGIPGEEMQAVRLEAGAAKTAVPEVLAEIPAAGEAKIRAILPESAAAQLCSMPWALWATLMYGAAKTPIQGRIAADLPAMCMRISASVSPAIPIPSVPWEGKSVMRMQSREI